MPDILQTIADSPPLFEAVKAVVLKQFEDIEGRVDEGVSDAALGQIYRAKLMGLQKVEAAFKEIASHRSRVEINRGVNPAR